MRKIILAICLLSPVFSFAQSTYDYTTGNSYNTYGNTTTGYNNKGESWSTTQTGDGNMRGVDKKGNSWNYNSGSGTYTNTNGTICTGKGAYRTCY